MQPSLIWRHPIYEEAFIVIEADVLADLDQYRQNFLSKPESGGILVGYRRENHLHIVSCTVPQRGDQSSRYTFTRRDKFHQRFAVAEWHRSGETLDYIGDWHSHPEAAPSPSRLDYSEWRKIIAASESPMVFMILGFAAEIWLAVGSKGNITPAIRC